MLVLTALLPLLVVDTSDAVASVDSALLLVLSAVLAVSAGFASLAVPAVVLSFVEALASLVVELLSCVEVVAVSVVVLGAVVSEVVAEVVSVAGFSSVLVSAFSSVLALVVAALSCVDVAGASVAVDNVDEVSSCTPLSGMADAILPDFSADS